MREEVGIDCPAARLRGRQAEHESRSPCCQRIEGRRRADERKLQLLDVLGDAVGDNAVEFTDDRDDACGREFLDGGDRLVAAAATVSKRSSALGRLA